MSMCLKGVYSIKRRLFPLGKCYKSMKNIPHFFFFTYNRLTIKINPNVTQIFLCKACEAVIQGSLFFLFTNV